MAHLNPDAHELLARQHGVIGADQLRAVGHSLNDVRWMQRRGALVLVVRGAYRSPSVEFTELSRCAAVSIARRNVAVAGPTAGRLWGFRRMPRDHRIHVLAPRASNPAIAPWVVAYRTDARHDEDIVERGDGIRLTSRARTAFDLARWLTPDDLLSVVEQAVRDGNLSDDDLRAVAVDWLSRRRPWAYRYLAAVDRRFRGGAAESHGEVRVAEALRRAGLRGLVRQFAIELEPGRRARFDLAIPAVKLAIEVDLHPRHEETAGRRSDAERDRLSAALGWTTIRITNEDYLHHFERRIADVVELHRILADTRGDARKGQITAVPSSQRPTDERTGRMPPVGSSQGTGGH